MARRVTFVGSWSELDAMRQCPHKHELAYLERWESDKRSPALQRGQLFHLVMEQHNLIQQRAQHRRATRIQTVVKNIEAARLKILAPYLDSDEEDQRELGLLVQWMHEGYLEMYGPLPEWEVLYVEHAFQAPLPMPDGVKPSAENPVIFLRGRADLVVKWKGRIWLVDHKTCKDLPKQKDLDLADQFGVYTWLLRQATVPVFGVMHDAVRTTRLKTKVAPLDERFVRTPSYRTDKELDVIAAEAYQTLRRAYAPSNRHERHPDEDRCGWRCPFTEACLHGRKTTPEQERDYLGHAGFRRVTEEEQWLTRGYNLADLAR